MKDPRPVSTGPADSPEGAAARAAWLNEGADARGVPKPPRRTFPAMVKVEITNAHGTFTTDTFALDLTMLRHLPATPGQLRGRLSLWDLPPVSYGDVGTLTEMLVMLAARDYPWKGL